MSSLEIVYRPRAELKADPRNARTHSPEQVQQVAESMRQFGFTNPVLIRPDKTIGAGHGRWAAAELAGIDPIPTIMLNLNDDQWRAYALADNRLALNAGWDEDLLKQELLYLEDKGYDLTGAMGFEETELRKLLDSTEGQTDGEEVPDLPETPVSRPGDMWLLGRHRLLCGDSTKPEDVHGVIGKDKPHLLVSDPPYGVNYDPSWRERELDTWKAPRATGQVMNDDKADWTEVWKLFPGAVAYVWHGGLHSGEVEASLRSAGFEMRAQIIWAKQHFVISRGDYHWQHEPCWYAVRKGKKGSWAGDRKQATVWQIMNASAMGGDTTEGSTGHGTQKPLECMRRPILNNSKPGDWVFEPFSGSFSTGIACEETGRKCMAIEIDPRYVDCGIVRWQGFTGLEATHAETGLTFEQMKDQRANEASQ